MKAMKKNKQYINPYKQFNGVFIPDWLLKRKELSSGAKICYARLARFAGKDGSCYPGIEKLSEEISVSERQCKRYISELKDNDLIESKQRGLGQSNKYYFLYHEWMNNSIKDTGTDRSDIYGTPKVTDVARHKESHLRDSIDISQIKQLIVRYFIDKVDGAYDVVPEASLYDNIKTIIDKGYTVEQIKKLIDHKAAQFHRREIDTRAFRLSWLFKPVNFFEQYSIMERPAQPKQRKQSGTNNGAKVTTDSKKWDDVKSL